MNLNEIGFVIDEQSAAGEDRSRTEERDIRLGRTRPNFFSIRDGLDFDESFRSVDYSTAPINSRAVRLSERVSRRRFSHVVICDVPEIRERLVEKNLLRHRWHGRKRLRSPDLDDWAPNLGCTSVLVCVCARARYAKGLSHINRRRSLRYRGSTCILD